MRMTALIVAAPMVGGTPIMAQQEPQHTPKWTGEKSLFGVPDDVKRAEDALTLFYINKKMYNFVHCQSKDISGVYFVTCGPDYNNPIGLFLISYRGEPAITPVNGKATQHLGGATQIGDMKGNPIQVRSASVMGYTNYVMSLSISEVMERFK